MMLWPLFLRKSAATRLEPFLPFIRRCTFRLDPFDFQLRGEQSGELFNLVGSQRQAMVGDRARAGSHRFDDIQPIHRLAIVCFTRDAAPTHELVRGVQVGRSARQEISV